MSELDDLRKELQELKTQVSTVSRRLTELDSSLTDHTGLDWGETLASIQSPHPNQFIRVASFGRDDAGRSTVEVSEDGIEIVSSTDVNDPEQEDRYVTWLDDANGRGKIAKLGTYYDANLSSTQAIWAISSGLSDTVYIICTSDLDDPIANRTIGASISGDHAGGSASFLVESRSASSSTLRNLLEVTPHLVASGRIKVGYNGAGNDEIIALVLDNADDTGDLPTAGAGYRGGLALVEGSPDKIYVCRSPDGGSSYEWVELADAVGGGMELIVKESDESVTSSTTLQDDDDFVIPIGANQSIQFEGWLFCSDGGGVIDYTFTAPSGAVGGFYDGAGGGGESHTELGTERAMSSTGTSVVVPVRGAVHNGANAGNVTLQWAQTSSNGSPSTIHAGSYIKWQVQ